MMVDEDDGFLAHRHQDSRHFRSFTANTCQELPSRLDGELRSFTRLREFGLPG